MSLLHFDYIPYLLWRRRIPGWLRAPSRALLRRWYPVDEDTHPPATPDAMARFLARWSLLNGADESSVRRALHDTHAPVEIARPDAVPQPAPKTLVRIPAQWESTETVLVSYPVLHPRMWALHAAMIEAISPVANVTILLPARAWAEAVWLFLQQRGRAQFDHVRFLVLPLDDMWVRDYGPIVGLDAHGRQVVVNAIFDPLPNYPKTRDNAMPLLWSAHTELPVLGLDIHTEGGNLWSDGAGTLILSEQVFYSNPYLTREALLHKLHGVFAFDKLIVTPRLDREETGHVDLLVKLADAQTVLIPRPAGWLNRANLQATAALFRRETNAHGQSYRVIELPGLPPYLNWGVFPIWRTYTNALTVNGRVLVPTYGVPEDDAALDAYQRALPDYDIIPIDCRLSINGGGAVHCLTKEVPGNQPKIT